MSAAVVIAKGSRSSPTLGEIVDEIVGKTAPHARSQERGHAICCKRRHTSPILHLLIRTKTLALTYTTHYGGSTIFSIRQPIRRRLNTDSTPCSWQCAQNLNKRGSRTNSQRSLPVEITNLESILRSGASLDELIYLVADFLGSDPGFTTYPTTVFTVLDHVMEYVESRIFFTSEVEELIFSLKRELPHHRVLQEAYFRVGDHARAALCKQATCWHRFGHIGLSSCESTSAPGET